MREEVFSAHRIVLAASSDYFHAMFAHGMKESNQEVIELKDESISAAALKIVLDSIYSGDLQVNDENVLDVLVVKLQVLFNSVVITCKPSLFSFDLMCKRIVKSVQLLIDTV